MSSPASVSVPNLQSRTGSFIADTVNTEDLGSMLRIVNPDDENDELAAGELQLEDLTAGVALGDITQKEAHTELIRKGSFHFSTLESSPEILQQILELGEDTKTELHTVLLDSIMIAGEPEEESLDSDGKQMEDFCKEQGFPSMMVNIMSRFGASVAGPSGPIGIKSIAAGLIQKEELDDTFYIVDLANTYRLFSAWKNALPMVTPFYAMKCCPEPSLVATLGACGAGFDCASAAEIQLALNEGVGPNRIIFAHPCKRPSDIRFAKSKGVKLTTFDSINEVEKLAQYYKACELVLRIRADDPTAIMPLGSKYGANMDEVTHLLTEVKKLHMKVVGVSFHVGSGARDPEAFAVAIALAKQVFDEATAMGFHMRLLDLGGGFTGRFDSDGNVQSMMGPIPTAIKRALAEHFPEGNGHPPIQIIAEPGRYFAEASMHLATHVHGFREREERADALDHALLEKLQIGIDETQVAEHGVEVMAPFVEYWISDGLYGSLNCVIYDHAVPRAWLLPSPTLPPMENGSTLIRSTVFGPTCDSLDVVFRDVLLPHLRVGDWLLFPFFGAYSIAGATNFNGIQAANANKYYICSKSGVDETDSLVMWACEMSSKPSSLVAG